MKRASALTYAITLALCTHPSISFGQVDEHATQSAQAVGPCSAAVNATGSARVTVRLDCVNPKIRSTVNRLAVEANQVKGRFAVLDRHYQVQGSEIARGQTRLNAQDERISRLEDDNRLIRDEITKAVLSVNARAQLPNATPAAENAAALLEQGDASGAINLLGREADATLARSRQSGKEAAALYLQQAALLQTKNVELAFQAAERAVAADPENFNALGMAGDLAAVLGQTDRALQRFRGMGVVAKALAASDPHNSQWQRDLAVSYERIGNMQAAQGDTDAALASYRERLAIGTALAASDPHNTQWRSDLDFETKRIEVMAKRVE